ncbi:unnamed protein product [Scytosiphon promiscuus]
MSGKPAPGKPGAGGARGVARKGAPKKQGDVIVSVDEKVWTLRMGSRDPPSNVARFEEMWVGKGESKRKVTRPPFDDPSVFSKPAYMYREQEPEEHSEDEDYEGPGKFDAFDRPAFKRRTIKSRSIQWALEDRVDYSKGGGIKYLGDKITQQMSRYATFKVDPQRTQTIEVTPIEEWWQFKKAPRDEGKMMSVKEAEELMKKQDNFLGPLSLANKVLGQKSLEAAREAGGSSRYGNLDREDTQVLKEAGVKLGGPEDGVGLDGFGGDGSGSDDGLKGIEVWGKRPHWGTGVLIVYVRAHLIFFRETSRLLSGVGLSTRTTKTLTTPTTVTSLTTNTTSCRSCPGRSTPRGRRKKRTTTPSAGMAEEHPLPYPPLETPPPPRRRTRPKPAATIRRRPAEANARRKGRRRSTRRTWWRPSSGMADGWLRSSSCGISWRR